MDTKINLPEVRNYLLRNETVSPSDFALKKHPFETISTKKLTQQLVGLQKSKKKLPLWYDTPDIIFPPKINLEQTSSEKAAAYKASLVSGKKMIDITGGFGIDSFFFSKQIDELHYCELNPDLHAIATHNFNALAANNITTHCADGVTLFEERTSTWDWMYVDPSRRNDTKGKVFLLEDCLPNVIEMQGAFFDSTRNVMIKTAPIYDITEGLRVLKNVKEIHVVAVNNEVKELLWILEKDFKGKLTYVATSIEKTQTHAYKIDAGLLENSTSTYADVGTYLYEPFSVFMKLGGFDWLSANFKLNKLHRMAHLYSSDNLIDFPGKIFKVQQVLPYNKSSIKQLTKQKASVVTRNFKINAAALRKKLKLKEDDQRFLFFTTGNDGKQIIVDVVRLK